MPIKSILVATDLSVEENGAILRAQQLADAHHAVLYVEELPTKTKPGELDELIAKARGVDLVVLPHRHERSLAAFFLGQPLMRLLRECDRPVLVARTEPSASYLRIVVPVDFSGHSVALARLAADLQPPAQLRVIHAISTRDEARLRSAGAMEQAVMAFRERCRHYAQGRLLQIRSELASLGTRLFTKISHGDPARQAVADQQRSGADLIVVGKRHASAWEDFVFGSVAQRVLRWGVSDVLVVPEAHLQGRSQATSPPRPPGAKRPALSFQAAERRPS